MWHHEECCWLGLRFSRVCCRVQFRSIHASVQLPGAVGELCLLGVRNPGKGTWCAATGAAGRACMYCTIGVGQMVQHQAPLCVCPIRVWHMHINMHVNEQGVTMGK